MFITQRQEVEDVPAVQAPPWGCGRLSGVSQSTVSRVINGIPGVRPEVVQKVQSAVSQLRYTPNRAARSLVTSRPTPWP